jgi:hypothetical protein
MSREKYLPKGYAAKYVVNAQPESQGAEHSRCGGLDKRENRRPLPEGLSTFRPLETTCFSFGTTPLTPFALGHCTVEEHLLNGSVHFLCYYEPTALAECR